MPSELSVRAIHQGDMRIQATSGGHTVLMDYPLPPGTPTEGLTPLQLLLASLAGCSGNALVLLLKKAGQPVTGLEVQARGTRRDEHPTVITDIRLEILVRGRGVTADAVERALRMSEEHICPVWAMLRPGTPISASFRLVED